MIRIPTRQIHLDFHTSELIPKVGAKFRKEDFQAALRMGRVNSVTVFARCHHGWCYYPTKVGRMHPTLEFDLLGAMMEACHEIGVRAPIYLTNGWVAQEAISHPEWMAREKDGRMVVRNLDPKAAPDDPRPICSWHEACPGGGYKAHLHALIEEICGRYEHVDGFFIDINCFSVCWCDSCRTEMKKRGLDPERDEDAKAYFEIKWLAFFQETHDLIRSLRPDATIFFNHCANPYHTERFPFQTHFEMEDMPTVWDGYDRLPARAMFFNKVGKEYVGQTGKFHKVWGEFGTYKNPDALKYECATMASYGAKCNVGDQLHPSGEMNPDTYRIIGEAYRYIEEIEPWCYDVEGTSRLGVYLSGHWHSDMGVWKMLLEGQRDFEMVMEGEDLSRYDVVVLPDEVRLDAVTAERLKRFVADGGGVLLTGSSGLDRETGRFQLDIGAQYAGRATYKTDFAVVSSPDLAVNLVASPFLFYEAAERVVPTTGEVLATIREPYFDRTYGHYCGHLNTPYVDATAAHPAAVRKGRVVYLAHPLCRQYNDHGAQIHRDYFLNALRMIDTAPVLDAPMPSAGRVHLARQNAEHRLVLHLTYASPVQRGEVRVVEDMVPIRDIPVSIRASERIRSVCLEPQGAPLPFRQKDGVVAFAVPEVVCHQMVVMDYSEGGS
jgi:hypothetical protein